MKKKYAFPFFLLMLSLGFHSCDLFHPATPVPGYLHIDKIDVQTVASQGSNSSKLSDAWVYVDDQLIGCFELPATFPVISQGTHEVKVRGGIKVNGIAANRSPYPFYTTYSKMVDFQPGQKVTLTPVVNYNTAADFDFVEGFENPGVLLDSTLNSDSNIKLINSPSANVFEGTYSGLLTTTPSRPFVEVASVYKYDLPTGGAPVFLELNYKCNYEFTVSIYAWGLSTVGQFTVLHYNPSLDWNKTYTYLTPTVSSAYSAVNYQVAIGMLNSTGADSTYLLLDNIKLVH
jgi:hypothetical protein